MSRSAAPRGASGPWIQYDKRPEESSVFKERVLRPSGAPAGYNWRTDEEEPVSKKILIPIGDASEVLDTYYPLFRFEEEGWRSVVAGC